MIGRPFEKGHPSNGRRAGARNRISTKLLETLERDFQEHGDGVVKILRVEYPADYMRLIGSLVPKELEISTNQLNELSQDELELAIEYARKRLAERSIQLGIREEPTTIN
jgi:hypothetical protein